jgi:hypothetical protein
MEKFDRLELIQKYFRDELNPEELEAFHLLEHDPGFREELAEYEFFHDLLEAGSLMEEEEALMANAALEPALNEPRFRTADQGSSSKLPKMPGDDGKKISKPAASHQQAPLQLRRSKVLRYAIAASVLLTLVFGLTFYLNNKQDGREKITGTPPLTTQGPLIASIRYIEESENPARDLQIPDTMFMVKIYPPADDRNFHYLLGLPDTLHLYGNFNPKDLMLKYDDSIMEFQLTYKSKTYLLERNNKISPLSSARK